MTSFAKRFNLDDAWIEEQARMFENEEQEVETGGVVHAGSHLDAVGRKRVTVIYPAKETQKVEALARARGCKSSDIYRTALTQYLATV